MKKTFKTSKNRKRLTPRQKQLIFRKLGIPAILFILSVTIAIVAFGINSKAKTIDTEKKYYKSVTIKSGQTLTNFAEEYADEHYASKAEYIKEVARINSIDPDKIKSGNNIIIPYYSENPQ